MKENPVKLSDLRIKELENELSKKQKDLDSFRDILASSQEILKDALAEKKIIQARLDQLELMKVEYNIRQHQQLKNDYQKLEHRYQITKKLLEEARQVIKDLEKRGVTDYFLGKYPESLLEFNK
ncbi:MAG: hypothetical protein Q8N08_02875 [Methanobacteriaceae archaeon]|nr:hypothetical protein [Methanobacteriaceae archaeon]